MTTKIVLDCDPANDDALAILTAAGHPGIELLAVTTVAGHLVAEETAHNAAIAVAVAGLDVPVAAGSTRPLVREQILAGILDHETGLDRHRDDLPAVELDPRHAVDVLAETFAAHPGATLVLTGPLTNLALGLRRHPGLAANIGHVITLGGAWGLGNKSAAAEFNILCDPEAAAVVYGAGLPLTMVPVDATGEIGITPALLSDVATRATPPAAFAHELLSSLVGTHRSGPGPLAREHAPLHDPTAVLLAADPTLATTMRARVDVETQGRLTYGRTVVDLAGKSPEPANVDVVLALDTDRVRAAFLASLAGVGVAADRAAALAGQVGAR
ncbi:MAG: nucleoside hydrolase [Georgenia sp.]